MFPVGKSGLIERESGDFEDHEQDPQHGDQLLNPRAKPQDLLLQLNHIHIEDVDRHDLGRRMRCASPERSSVGCRIGQRSSRPVSSGPAPEGGGHNASECGLW